MPRLRATWLQQEGSWEPLLSPPGLAGQPLPALSSSLLLQQPPTGRETLTWKKIEVMSFVVYNSLFASRSWFWQRAAEPPECVCGRGSGQGEEPVGGVPVAPPPATPRPPWPRATSPISYVHLETILSQRCSPGLLAGAGLEGADWARVAA